MGINEIRALKAQKKGGFLLDIKNRIKICRFCQKEFVPANKNLGGNVFCSHYCRTKHQWETQPPRGVIKRKTVYQICKFCGKEFEKKTQYGLSKTVKYCSHKCSTDDKVGNMPKRGSRGNAGGFTYIQRGSYICSKGDHYFRSKWEANYALYLDFLVKNFEIERWEFESDVFVFGKIKSGNRSYRPDFKVYRYDGSIEYHEVKGYMDSRSKTKLKRMKKYYPEIKLILIEKEFYKDMLKKLSGVIKFNK